MTSEQKVSLAPRHVEFDDLLLTNVPGHVPSHSTDEVCRRIVDAKSFLVTVKLKFIARCFPLLPCDVCNRARNGNLTYCCNITHEIKNIPLTSPPQDCFEGVSFCFPLSRRDKVRLCFCRSGRRDGRRLQAQPLSAELSVKVRSSSEK